MVSSSFSFFTHLVAANLLKWRHLLTTHGMNHHMPAKKIILEGGRDYGRPSDTTQTQVATCDDIVNIDIALSIAKRV